MSRRNVWSLAVVVMLAAGCGAAEGSAPSGIGAPFVADGGLESGPTSGYWGDGGSGPTGMHIGCIRDRRLAVVITVRNRTGQTITILGGGDRSQPFRNVIERVAVQVRLASPPPGNGLVGRGGLRAWSERDSSAVAVPPGRSAWVQSNFLMHDCGSLTNDRAITVNRSVILAYDLGGGAHADQPVVVKSARIILTRGPLHPKVPINTIG